MPKKQAAKKAQSSFRDIKSLIERLKGIVDVAADSLPQYQETYDKLKKPLEELIRLQREEVVEEVVDKKESLSRLSEWMRREAPDCFIDQKFQFVTDLAEGCGVVATQDLKKDEMFIRVPRKLMISTETALKSPLGSFFRDDAMCQRMPSLALAVHLLFEKLRGPDSYFYPYIQALPTEQELALPFFYEEHDLLKLRASPVYEQTLQLIRATLRQYIYLQHVLKKEAGHLRLPPFLYHQFRWAVAIVMSRQNRIPASDAPEKSVQALIPGWDMCNYATGYMNTVYNVQGHTSESCAMSDVSAGQQIYIYYGDRPNWQLLLYQGFVVPNNIHDTIKVTLSLSEQDPLVKLKKMFLHRRFMKPSETFEIGGQEQQRRQKLETKLLEFIKVAALNKEEATFIMKYPDEEKISSRLEIASLEFLIAALERQNSAEAEQKEENEPSLHARLVARLLHEEKIVTEQTIAKLRQDLAAVTPYDIPNMEEEPSQ